MNVIRLPVAYPRVAPVLVEQIKPTKFKQSDFARAVKAARSVGLDVLRSEVAPDGRIVLTHATDAAPPLPDTEFDAWKARRDARKTQGN